MLALTAGGGVLSPAAASAFHPARSPSEIALDRILHLADADDMQLANLLHRPESEGRVAHVDYTRILTRELISAISREERHLVRKDCDGRYRDGEECGFDYSPITCARDSGLTYLYRTVREDGDRAEIVYEWKREGGTAATYKMVKDEGVWKIDGVLCAIGDRFHWRRSE